MKASFGAEIKEYMADPSGHMQHAEVTIKGSVIVIGDASDEREPKPAMVCLYLTDVDEAYTNAMAAGGTSIMEPADQFYVDRNGGVSDPQGNIWWLATHIEDISPEEMQERAKAHNSK